MKKYLFFICFIILNCYSDDSVYYGYETGSSSHNDVVALGSYNISNIHQCTYSTIVGVSNAINWYGSGMVALGYKNYISLSSNIASAMCITIGNNNMVDDGGDHVSVGSYICYKNSPVASSASTILSHNNFAKYPDRNHLFRGVVAIGNNGFYCETIYWSENILTIGHGIGKTPETTWVGNKSILLGNEVMVVGDYRYYKNVNCIGYRNSAGINNYTPSTVNDVNSSISLGAFGTPSGFNTNMCMMNSHQHTYFVSGQLTNSGTFFATTRKPYFCFNSYQDINGDENSVRTVTSLNSTNDIYYFDENTPDFSSSLMNIGEELQRGSGGTGGSITRPKLMDLDSALANQQNALQLGGPGAGGASVNTLWVLIYVNATNFNNYNGGVKFTPNTYIAIQGERINTVQTDQRSFIIKNNDQFYICNTSKVSTISERESIIYNFVNNTNITWGLINCASNDFRFDQQTITYSAMNFTNVQGVGFWYKRSSQFGMTAAFGGFVIGESFQGQTYCPLRGELCNVSFPTANTKLSSVTYISKLPVNMTGNFIVNGKTNLHFWVQFSTNQNFSVTNASFKSDINTNRFKYVDLTTYSYSNFPSYGLPVSDQSASDGLVACIWANREDVGALKEEKYYIRAASATNPPNWTTPAWRYFESQVSK